MIISAVIPLYNKSHTIARALQSVFAQTRLPDALIVVDDGSTDGSAAACRSVLATAPEGIACQLISQENTGVSVARNAGAEAIQSDLIAFLDADDEWLPVHIAELERLATKVPSAGILSTRHARLTPQGQPAPEPSAVPAGFFGQVENGLAAYSQGYGILHTSSIAVGRGAWQRSGGFSPGARKSQDIHLWLRLLLTEPFAHSDTCTAIWHEEASGVVRRSGAVPAHFSHFLGTPEGRAHLKNQDLVNFLATNLARHVAGHRMRRDDQVVDQMVQLSRALYLGDRIKIKLISHMPRTLLDKIAQCRRQTREAARHP